MILHGVCIYPFDAVVVFCFLAFTQFLFPAAHWVARRVGRPDYL
jgi:hypothetical protein